MVAVPNVLERPGLVPFIWVHHPHTPTPSLTLPTASDRVVRIDAVEYPTLRAFYSGILGKLNGQAEEVTSWDTFVRALKVIAGQSGPSSAVKGKRKAGDTNGHAHQNGGPDVKGLSVIVTHAERLRTILGPGWTVFTRLAEVTGMDVTVALCSSVTWDEVRPPRGDAVEPVIVDIAPQSSDDIRESLLGASTHPLYPRFLDLIIPVLSHLVPSPSLELEYISTALWPIYTSALPPHLEQNLLVKPYPDPADLPPPLQVTMKLVTELKHAMSVPLAVTIEELLSRRAIGPANFPAALAKAKSLPRLGGRSESAVLDMEMCAKFLMIAGYCASYNPPKSDQRLFGRVGVDGKRRRGGGARRAGYGRTKIGKIPQRLLGPKPFSLDRLLALFAALYVEHAPRPDEFSHALDFDDFDDETDWTLSAAEIASRRAEKLRAKEVEMDQRWDEEVEHLSMSMGLWNLIPELESQGLLKRMSPIDRLDNITLRCEVDYEQTKSLAKELRLTLDEYLYEATA